MNQVKIEIDAASGRVAVECPEDSLSVILERIESFLPKLGERKVNSPQLVTRSTVAPAGTGDEPVKQKKSKPGTYQMVDLGMSKEQARQLGEFYAEKNPKKQNDQVLVIMFWLNRNLNRDEVDVDEIFSGFRNIALAKVPARIESVISNLVLENKVVRSGGKFKINHIGDDRVEQELPESTK